MTDRREQILQRLLAILTAIATSWRNDPSATIPSGIPVKEVVRSRGEMPPEKRPAIMLLDAGEVARPGVAQSRGRLTAGPQLVDMTPEIYVVMDLREPDNELLGEDLNAMRMVILKAIMFDGELATILGGNGSIRFAGAQTDLGEGRFMEGKMIIQMTFGYPLIPSEL